MKFALTARLLVLGLLTLLLSVPVWMVRGTVQERAGYRQEAVADIARSWGGRQTVIGPLLVRTYETTETVQVWDENRQAYVEQQEQRPHRVVVFPDTLQVGGDVGVEHRYRGIHGVPVYLTELTLSGELAVPETPAEARNVRQVLVLAVSDSRGIRRVPELTWNGNDLAVQPGTGTALGNGVHAVLQETGAGSRPFTLRIALGGTGALAVAPVGDGTRIELASHWPHPRFTGGYLPESRRVEADGFEAIWRTTRYAAPARRTVEQCLLGNACLLAADELVTLELDDPVDVYALNDRATKYALLFILILFGVFFVYEVLKRLRIHPVQYTLVGLGQALFFLLLLSLSEHVSFGLAYAAGAAASIALLTFYVSYVLGGLRRAAGLAGVLTVLYAALFVMLRSEDYALLLGSLLLLIVLATAMFLTRRLDWYALERRRPEATA